MNQLTLITLLVQMGMIAAIATILVRFGTFKRMLFSEKMRVQRKLYLTTIVGSIFAIGVLLRLVMNYRATDLTLPGTLLVGILAGPVAGVGVGILVGLPPVVFGEYLALPIAVFSGLLGGVIFYNESSLEKRMDFSPFTILKAYRYLEDFFKKKKISSQLLIILSGICLQIAYFVINDATRGKLLYSLNSKDLWVRVLIIFGTLATIGIPLKIWNNTRVELLLMEKEKKLADAKLEALKSKIKPHFLFNTLNTIFSTIRVDPDKARGVVLRLSEVLRFILDSKGDFCRLSEEIDLLDSYMSIEEARFGKGRIIFEKNIGEGTHGLYVPTMILQPIVENSIKHGLSKNIDSGRIILSSIRNENYLEIEVRDDGAGIPESRLPGVKREGIGLSNVDERLKVLFEDSFDFTIQSRENEGTTVRLKIPVISDLAEENT